MIPPFRLRRGLQGFGFTLIELLAAVAIMAILLALLFSAFRNLREKAQLTFCQNNLRQIGIGMQGFIADNARYPLARSFTNPGQNWTGPFWANHLYDYTGSLSAEHLKHQGRTKESIFYCPSTPLHHGISDYGANPHVILHPDGPNDLGLLAVRVSKPARTILLLDNGRVWPPTGQEIGGWTLSRGWISSPPATPLQVEGPTPRHGGKLNVLFCDGRVESMTYDRLLESYHPDAFAIE